MRHCLAQVELTVMALAALTACGRTVGPGVVASPFPADSSLFAVALDAVSAREVMGSVGVVPDLLDLPSLEGVPLPVRFMPTDASERAMRRQAIRSLGFRVDSIADPGNCPGFWSNQSARSECPAAPRTTIVQSRPQRVSEGFCADSRPRGGGSHCVRLLFVFSGPDGSGLTVADYFARHTAGAGWSIVGKRIVFQTE